MTKVKKLEDGTVKTRVTLLKNELSSRNLFHWCLLIGMVIPFCLLCVYSYSSDMQAQGRYILPMTLPFMYFVSLGYQFLLNRWIKKEKTKEKFYTVGACLAAGSAVLVFLTVVVPAYVR